MIGIKEVFGGIASIVSTWLQGRNEKQKAQLEMQLAELQNKARLLADRESNNHNWEMANLTDKDKWLRRISFAMFASPFIIAIFAPHHINDYFTHAIHNVPEWWQKTFMAINGGVWGLSSLKNILPGIADVFKK